MNSWKQIAVSSLVVFALLGGISVDALTKLREAFENLSPEEKLALGSIGGPTLIDDLEEVSSCIQGQLTGVDVCHFNASFDPLYYLEQCLSQTDAGQKIATLIETFVNNPLVIEGGVPPTIYKERCFNIKNIPSPLNLLNLPKVST